MLAAYNTCLILWIIIRGTEIPYVLIGIKGLMCPAEIWKEYELGSAHLKWARKQDYI